MALWSRYPKIAESSASFKDCGKGEWLVTEKIHGANFSVVGLPDGQVQFASRSGVLATTDPFFGYKRQGLDRLLLVRIGALRDSLERDGQVADDDAVIVYGELCGGHYPHPEVPAEKDSKPVQSGIWYAPTLCFVGFDVAIISQTSAIRYLSFDTARAAAIAAGIQFAVPLCRGAMTDCLNFEVRFSSTLPAELGLPPLPEFPNWAEGVVVRPAREPEAGCDGRKLIKRKIPEFSEKQYATDNWREARHDGGGSTSYADAEMLLRYEMLAAVSQQRLDNVLSKVGHVDVSDKSACRKLLDDFVVDVLETLVEDGLISQVIDLARLHAPLQQELEDASRKLVASWLRKRMSSTTETHANATVINSD